MVNMGDVVSAGIAGIFGSDIESLVLVGGLEVSLQVDPHFVRARFFAPALAHGSKTAGLVHKCVAYVDLFLLRGGVPDGFVEGDAVLDFLECLFDGHRWIPRGGCIFFVYIKLQVGDHDVREK